MPEKIVLGCEGVGEGGLEEGGGGVVVKLHLRVHGWDGWDGGGDAISEGNPLESSFRRAWWWGESIAMVSVRARECEMRKGGAGFHD
jgi:hypothetical protein